MAAGDLLYHVIRRQIGDPEGPDGDATEKEIFASWSLFILITLLIVALMTSYLLQEKRIQAVHETVISIFAGMFVGLVLRLTSSHTVLGAVSFDYKFFFNLLLPPILVASGYELRQDNFFRKIGTILTFAFVGTFISATVLGMILWVWTWLPFDSSVNLTFVDAMSVGATLSATDPVTILAIFNSYKVDPGLYTIIFGESILNDAVSIVFFETAQKYRTGEDRPTLISLVESFGLFGLVFFGSLIIGVVVGIYTSLLLKLTMLRKHPKIESCVVVLIAYASYFFANAIHMSGIVSLLFCGICLKRYAYHNLSRRSKKATKYIFQLTSQLSENFIFIYLGLSLFTDTQLEFRPGIITISVVGICVARYCAVFPISNMINWFRRRQLRSQPNADRTDAIPHQHKMMLFWAGLRGAVGVALSAGLAGPNAMVLRATVLVVVVLTVIVFGGTTARMLEILNIETGVEEAGSDGACSSADEGVAQACSSSAGRYPLGSDASWTYERLPLAASPASAPGTDPKNGGGETESAAAAAAATGPNGPGQNNRRDSNDSIMLQSHALPPSPRRAKGRNSNAFPASARISGANTPNSAATTRRSDLESAGGEYIRPGPASLSIYRCIKRFEDSFLLDAVIINPSSLKRRRGREP